MMIDFLNLFEKTEINFDKKGDQEMLNWIFHHGY